MLPDWIQGPFRGRGSEAEEVGELDSLALAAAEGAAVLAEGYVAQTDVVQGHEFGGDADGCGLSCG